ncbi:MAG: hypothetical protein ABI461_02415 [Polyangiaceae bacterium]
MKAAALFGVAALAALPVTLLVLSSDARLRRRLKDTQVSTVIAVAKRLPSTDLALSGGARWLRTPSLEEPGAAFSDGPALPDPDPAGGAMSPPRAVWSEQAALGQKP